MTQQAKARNIGTTVNFQRLHGFRGALRFSVSICRSMHPYPAVHDALLQGSGDHTRFLCVS